jgi:hypothetical protein
MNLKHPVSAVVYPISYEEEQKYEAGVIAAYEFFIYSRLKEDSGSYRNAAAFVEGEREKNMLLDFSIEKRADLGALAVFSSEGDAFTDIRGEIERPSFTQYVLDTDFNVLSHIKTVFHFMYRREYKTLKLFGWLEQSWTLDKPKVLLLDAIRRQRNSILRLDAKLSAERVDYLSLPKHDFSSLEGGALHSSVEKKELNTNA